MVVPVSDQARRMVAAPIQVPAGTATLGRCPLRQVVAQDGGLHGSIGVQKQHVHRGAGVVVPEFGSESRRCIAEKSPGCSR